MAADAKLNFDDNAEFRQKELFALRDTTQEDPREVEAHKSDLNYIGRTGCLISPGWSDQEELAMCDSSLESIGIPLETRLKLWRVLAAVLMLGQIDFGEAQGLAEAKIFAAVRTQRFPSPPTHDL